MNATVNKNGFSPFSTIVVFIVLMIIGIAFIPKLNFSYQPNRTLPQLSVSFYWPNASPKVIEDETSKIEGVLGKITQLKNIKSSSSSGSGSVTLEFEKTADLDQKRYQVSTLLRQLRGNLPEEMTYPEISTSAVNEDDISFMVLTLNSNASTYYIKKVASQQVIPMLLKVNGISDIRLYGSIPFRWEVKFDPGLLKNYSLSPGEISSVINRLGDKIFLGTQKDISGSFIPIIASTKFIEPEDWGSLPIANKGGRIIKLSDVATVKLKESLPASYFRINGKNAVNLVIYASRGENQIKLSRELRKQLDVTREILPLEYSVQVTSDSTEFIREELTKIGLRTLFSLIILLVFVLAVSYSFRVFIIITFSLLANLLIACMFYFLLKIEINIYSLAGISVSFGIIIDNSIIMVTHLQKQKGLRVYISLLAATLTTLGALSVVFFLKENQSVLLIDFTYVMIINLSVSLVVSLILVPALMEKAYPRKSNARAPIRMLKRVVKITNFYYRFIVFEKRFKWVFIVFIILAFGFPINSIPGEIEKETKPAQLFNKTLGAEKFQSNIKPILEKIFGGSLRLFSEYVFESSFYSDPGKTTLNIRGQMPEGCTIQQLNVAIQKMEQYVSQFREVERFETSINGAQSSSVTIQFTKEAEDSSFPYLLKKQVEARAISLGGMDWSITGVGQGFSNSLYLTNRNSHILLTGYNYDQLYKYAELLEKKLSENDRVKDIEISSSGSYRSSSRHEFKLEVDRELLTIQGLNYGDYEDAFSTQLFNGRLNSFYNETELQRVVLLSDLSEEYNKWDFYNIPVDTRRGQKKLSQTGKISKLLVENSIEKENQEYKIYLNYNAVGPAQLNNIVQKKEIDAINDILPLGYKAQKAEDYYYWDSFDKKQYFLLLLMIIIIFFITSVLFESLLKPLVVICLIPISFIGVFLTFYLFDFNFDQGGFASFILLSGLVVNAAIYIINDFNNLVSRENKPVSIRTYLKAYNQKIIAIALTTLSTVFGLVPFVWDGQKEVFWFSFAVGAIGGLLFSLLAVFIYLPLLLKLNHKSI